MLALFRLSVPLEIIKENTENCKPPQYGPTDATGWAYWAPKIKPISIVKKPI
jgi:hypothetical protein